MSILYEAVTKKNGLQICSDMIQSGSFEDQLKAIDAVGSIHTRGSYDLLIDLVSDDKLAPNAIMSLARLGDSRSLFPLINKFNQTERPVIQQRVLQYMAHTADPRAEDFLTDYLINGDCFLDIAGDALKKSKGNSDFLYSYVGSDKDLEIGKKSPLSFRVDSETLDGLVDIFEELKDPSYVRPQTFVVKSDGAVYIGGRKIEHFDVANGEKVYAAGEIEFEKDLNGWSVSMINSRTSGYLVAPSSFRWVKEYFEKSDVRCDKVDYDEYLPREGFNDPDFLSIFKFGTYFKE